MLAGREEHKREASDTSIYRETILLLFLKKQKKRKRHVLTKHVETVCRNHAHRRINNESGSAGQAVGGRASRVPHFPYIVSLALKYPPVDLLIESSGKFFGAFIEHISSRQGAHTHAQAHTRPPVRDSVSRQFSHRVHSVCGPTKPFVSDT